jgi:sialic acid synthase SpsE
MYTIAEMADNHGNDEGIVEKTIEFIEQVGFDAVKFQAYEVDDFISSRNATMYGMCSKDYFSKYRMSPNLLEKAVGVCEREHIQWGVSPTRSRLTECLQLSPDFIKVGSDMMLDVNFIEEVSCHDVDVIVSTGMVSIEELSTAMKLLLGGKCHVKAIMHCTSQYPTLPENAHIGRIGALRRAYPFIPVGYSHHGMWDEMKFQNVRLAIAAGAEFIEQHVTLHRSYTAIGDRVSINRDGMDAFVNVVNETVEMMGEDSLIHSSKERASRKKWLVV